LRLAELLGGFEPRKSQKKVEGEDVGERVLSVPSHRNDTFLAQESNGPTFTSLPNALSRLFSHMFPGVSGSILASRLTRPLPLDVYKPPSLTPAGMVARELEKREVALRRNASRANAAALRSVSKKARVEAATPGQGANDPPSLCSGGTLLGLAKILRGSAPSLPVAVSASVTKDKDRAPSELYPPHRMLHGWGTSAALASQASAHWRTHAYSRTVSVAAIGRLQEKTSATVGSSARGTTLADINRAELEAKRAKRGWTDPSITSRQRMATAPNTIPPHSSLPNVLPGGPESLPSLLAANGASLPRGLRWVGATVLEVVRSGDLGATSGRHVAGIIVWVGRQYFSIRLASLMEEGGQVVRRRGRLPQFTTLAKSGCVIKVQWPVRLNPPNSIPVELSAEILGESRAWE